MSPKRSSARDASIDAAINGFSAASYDAYVERRLLDPTAKKTLTLLMWRTAAPLAKLKSRLRRRRSVRGRR